MRLCLVRVMQFINSIGDRLCRVLIIDINIPKLKKRELPLQQQKDSRDGTARDLGGLTGMPQNWLAGKRDPLLEWL